MNAICMGAILLIVPIFEARVTPTPPPLVTTTPVPAGKILGCPDDWLSFNSQCYKINKGTKTWSQALSACRQSGGDLASITSLGEQDFLYSQARSVPGALWIGFSARRVPRYYQWSDGKKATYTHWARDEPNNSHDGAENCVTFNNYGAGYWSDTVCNLGNVQGYICKKNQSTVSATTPPNYKIGCPANGVGYNNLCYLFFETKMSFNAAEHRCKLHGGNLMTVSDRFIQAFLTSELTQHNGMYWIGLKTYQTGYYYYYWNNKARVRFTNFDQAHTGRELASCIAVKSQSPGTGLWHNNPCTLQLPFICETRREGFTLPPPRQTILPNGCPNGYKHFNGFCFKSRCADTAVHPILYTEKTGFSPIQSRCAHNRQTLPSPTVSILSSKRVTKPEGYGYSWSDGTAFDYSTWASGEPNNFNNNENCVEWHMASDSWRDANCYVAKRFACQIKKGSVIVEPTANPVITTAPLVTCGPSSVRHQGECYYISAIPRTWYQARDYCRTTVKGDLLSVHSADDSNFFISVLAKLSSSVWWIGLSLSGYKWSDGSAVQYLNWAENEEQKCVAVSNKDGYWRNENCEQVHPFVCKLTSGTTEPVRITPTSTKPLPGSSNNGNTNFVFSTQSDTVTMNSQGQSTQTSPESVSQAVTSGTASTAGYWKFYKGACYYFSTRGQTWYQARDYCRTTVKGDLLSIHSVDGSNFFISVLRTLGSSLSWIGLNELTLGGFRWSDGSTVQYINWADNEPDGGFGEQKCVAINNDDGNQNFLTSNLVQIGQNGPVHNYKWACTTRAFGHWRDENCDQIYPFICKLTNCSTEPTPTAPKPLLGNSNKGKTNFVFPTHSVPESTPSPGESTPKLPRTVIQRQSTGDPRREIDMKATDAPKHNTQSSSSSSKHHL